MVWVEIDSATARSVGADRHRRLKGREREEGETGTGVERKSDAKAHKEDTEGQIFSSPVDAPWALGEASSEPRSSTRLAPWLQHGRLGRLFFFLNIFLNELRLLFRFSSQTLMRSTEGLQALSRSARMGLGGKMRASQRLSASSASACTLKKGVLGLGFSPAKRRAAHAT